MDGEGDAQIEVGGRGGGLGLLFGHCEMNVCMYVLVLGFVCLFGRMEV